MTGARRVVLAAIAVAGCRVDDIDLTGKRCPCVEGWLCESSTNTCVRDPSFIDASSGPDADRTDGTPSTSCLGDVFGAELYFNGFDNLSGWVDFGGGTWMAQSSEAVQSNAAITAPAFAYPTAAASFADYRVLSHARRLAAGLGYVGISMRVQGDNDHRYRCIWRPSDGTLKLQYRRPTGTTFSAISETQINVGSIEGYNPDATFTLEVEANGSNLRCCVREVSLALVQGTDTMFTAGPPGIEVEAMSAAFGDFQVNAP